MIDLVDLHRRSVESVASADGEGTALLDAVRTLREAGYVDEAIDLADRLLAADGLLNGAQRDGLLFRTVALSIVIDDRAGVAARRIDAACALPARQADFVRLLAELRGRGAAPDAATVEACLSHLERGSYGAQFIVALHLAAPDRVQPILERMLERKVGAATRRFAMLRELLSKPAMAPRL